MPMLEVKNLTAGYGDIPVIRDVSLSVKQGEILLIGGENGAGKSTLLRAISGFNTAQFGPGVAQWQGHHRPAARKGRA